VLNVSFVAVGPEADPNSRLALKNVLQRRSQGTVAALESRWHSGPMRAPSAAKNASGLTPPSMRLRNIGELRPFEMKSDPFWDTLEL
jgi:hypothetical protein